MSILASIDTMASTLYTITLDTVVYELYMGDVMLICFNCSGHTKRQLDELVASGEFADYAEVIAASVANQTALSNHVSNGGILVLGEENDHGASARERSIMAPRGPTQSPRRAFAIPPLFSVEGLANASLEAPPVDLDESPGEHVVTANRWLWGQFNRFLPAKASCRALARLQLNSQAGVLLEEASLEIAKAAVELGQYLTALDEAQNAKREDATATAFPRPGPDIWKSRQRYATQFVGNADSEGGVSGMLNDLKLITQGSTRDGVFIRLTEPGLELARLRNPILDDESSKHGHALSEEEIRLLLRHIRRAVPQEDHAYRFLLEAVLSGATTPDALDERVTAASRKVRPPMTAAFVSTQRSGVIARMVDLGLVARVRSGLSVTYTITERGQQYVANATGRV